MQRTVFMVLGIVLAAVLLQGCETLKGAKQDTANTGGHLSRGVNAVLEADKQFEEKYW